MKKLDHFFARTLQFCYVPFKKHTHLNYKLTTTEKYTGRFLGFCFYLPFLIMPIIELEKNLNSDSLITLMLYYLFLLGWLGYIFSITSKELNNKNSAKKVNLNNNELLLSVLREKEINHVK